MNISEHVSTFEQEMSRRNYSPNTVKNYSTAVQVFFAKSPKDHPKNINETDIKRFLATFNEPNTQRHYHGAIKKFYEICLGQKNKFKYIPYARKNKKLPIVLSQAEIQKMFDVCENLKHKTILAILYSCGLRVSELINLKWQHINRANMVINIIAAKGNKDRQVPLSQQLIDLLAKYYYAYKTTNYIFEGQNIRSRYSERSVGEVIKQLAQKAGIQKRVYTHLIRHCSFTHLLEDGTDISIIQKVAGHGNIKTTQGYAHISNNIISKVKTPLSSINL